MTNKQEHWSLISVTEKGVVSVIRNVTEDECKFYYQVLQPGYGVTEVCYQTTRPPEHQYRSFHRYQKDGEERSYHDDFNFGVEPLKFSAVEVFGPPGWDDSVVLKWKKEWPKRETILPEDPRNHFEYWYQKHDKARSDNIETYDPRNQP